MKTRAWTRQQLLAFLAQSIHIHMRVGRLLSKNYKFIYS